MDPWLISLKSANKLAELSGKHPLGRIATAEEVAQAALFLASEAAAFISGATLSVDGGISARLHDPD
jgi:NAD(P)-dependent dehydrogenase (short-subunit alcohol dehydrogenase family)